MAVPSLREAMERLVAEHLAGKSDSYKSAVREIFVRQVLFCDGTDQPERVQVTWRRNDDGQTVIDLHSPGRSGYGDTHTNAITLGDSGVVGLTFRVVSNIDSCPCSFTEEPPYLNDRTMGVVAEIETLQSLDLSKSKITDAGFARVRKLADLRSLDLERTLLTADGLAALKWLTRLEKLSISAFGKTQQDRTNNRYPAALCHHVAQCRRLRDLKIEQTRLDGKALRELASLRQLHTLALFGTLEEPAALSAFTGHERLDDVHLSFLVVDHGPVAMTGLPNLRRMSFSARGPVAGIQFSDLPKLEELSSTNAFTPVRLSNLPALHTLSVGVNEDEVVEANAARDVDAFHGAESALIPIVGLPSLKVLSLRYRRGDEFDPGEDGVELSDLPNLQRLTINAKRGAPGIVGVLPRLLDLWAYGHQRPAELCTILPAMPNLRSLELRSPHDQEIEAVTPAEFEPVYSLPNLETLKFYQLRADQNALERLLTMPNLTEADLEDCDFGEQLELVSHEQVQHFRLQSETARKISVREMQKLQRFGVIKSSQLEEVTFVDCPRLQSCWCTQTPALERIDLREAGLRQADQLDIVLGGKREADVVVRPSSDDH